MGLSRKFANLDDVYPDRLIECENYAIYKGEVTEEDIDALRKEKGTFVEQTLNQFVVGQKHVCLLRMSTDNNFDPLSVNKIDPLVVQFLA